MKLYFKGNKMMSTLTSKEKQRLDTDASCSKIEIDKVYGPLSIISCHVGYDGGTTFIVRDDKTNLEFIMGPTQLDKYLEAGNKIELNGEFGFKQIGKNHTLTWLNK